MKKIDCRSPEMVDTSADVLGCRFDIFEMLFAIVTGAGAAAIRLFFDPSGVTMAQCALGGLYGMGLFLVFKTLLPFFLYVRVVDVLRFRFAFYTICTAGVFAVMQSRAFHLAFSEVGFPSVVRLLALGAVLVAIFTVWTGSRGLLSLICLACGALFAYEPMGLISTIAVWAIFFFYRVRLRYAMMRIDSDDAYGGAYVDVARQLVRNMNRIATCRITGALLFFVGAALMLAVRFYLERKGLSTGDWAKGAVHNYLAGLKEMGDMQTLARSIVAFVSISLSMAFVRRSTDILAPLPSFLMVLYFILMVGSFGWAVGLPELVPVLASRATVSTGMMMADVAMGGVLVLSACVFLVEICCRAEEDFDMDWFDDNGTVNKASQMNRHIRAFFLAAFLLAAVVLVPVVLARLHFKLLY